MSRLSIITQSKAQTTIEELYKDLERRISASPSGLCPVDLASSFLKMCHAQSLSLIHILLRQNLRKSRLMCCCCINSAALRETGKTVWYINQYSAINAA